MITLIAPLTEVSTGKPAQLSTGFSTTTRLPTTEVRAGKTTDGSSGLLPTVRLSPIAFSVATFMKRSSSLPWTEKLPFTERSSGRSKQRRIFVRSRKMLPLTETSSGRPIVKISKFGSTYRLPPIVVQARAAMYDAPSEMVTDSRQSTASMVRAMPAMRRERARALLVPRARDALEVRI